MSGAVLSEERASLHQVKTADAVGAHTVLLLGNPNVGKTTLFNALTGQTARVGNYPGITVERRAGRLELDGESVELVDVPGAYSLSARSLEEQVAIEAALGLGDNPRPSIAVVVLDAGQLARNLYLATQLVECQIPLILALTMVDEVAGRPPVAASVGALFGVDCVVINPRQREGLSELKQCISTHLGSLRLGDAKIEYARGLTSDIDRVAGALPTSWRKNVEHDRALALWALLSLEPEDELNVPSALRECCLAVRDEADAEHRDIDLEIIGARYAFIDRHIDQLYEAPQGEESAVAWTERIDRVLLHPALGFGIFLAVMLMVFQSLFSWADPAISMIETLVGLSQEAARAKLPAGLSTDLIVEGLLGGVGNVVVFLPQILLLFFLVGLMEDSGYMARVAYLMDRVLRGVGLHGRAFVPMLSGLACAVPAIMSTRTMERRRDRILTMMVVPLMSCSARLPVYSLLIAALFPPTDVFGWVPVQGTLMVGMYIFSTVTTLLAAWVLGRTVVKGRRIPLILELPRYRWPSLGNTLRMMWLRTREFLTEAGTVILGFTIVLWLLLTFPRQDDVPNEAPRGQANTETVAAPSSLELSYGGRLGKALAPVMAPLGFDWKLTVGIIGAFSAREVFLSTMGMVYGLEDAESDEARPLRDRMRAETRSDGKPAYPPLVGLSLMVFFALACQCMSTIAVVKRETQSWRWPLLLFAYMTGLAYAASFLVYQLGTLMGFAG